MSPPRAASSARSSCSRAPRSPRTSSPCSPTIRTRSRDPARGVLEARRLASRWPFAGATIEFDPDTFLLQVRATQFVPGVTYTIESGPSAQGPWSPVGGFTPTIDALHAIDIPGAVEPFYKLSAAR